MIDNRLTQLLQKHHPDAFRWASHCCHHHRQDAEEVLQMTYLKIADGKARFNERSTFKTWLFTVIRNTAIDYRKKQTRYEQLNVLPPPPISEPLTDTTNYRALLTISLSIYAQDVFKKELFSADLVMKYRNEIMLSDTQADQIKKAHSGQIEAFNNAKWDLDNAIHKLDQQLAATKVSETEALAQMDKVLSLEESLKRMRLGLMIKIKNVLSADQQAKLKILRTDDDMNKPSFQISSINGHPRMVLKISGDQEGKEQPLFVIFDKNGKKSIVPSMGEISPDDIESIKVLKGESATKYGVEGKNGVVEITLKK